MDTEQPHTLNGEPDQPTRSFKTPFRGKSHFIPPKYTNPSLDTYCRLVRRDVSVRLCKNKEYKVWNNSYKEQCDELKALKDDKTLVVLTNIRHGVNGEPLPSELC